MTDRVKIDLPYIHAFKDRHGRERFYFRRKGFTRAALPHVDDPGFLAAYESANAPPRKPESSPTIIKGSLKDLCHAYEHSAEFKQLAVLTQREIRYVLRWLINKGGEKPAALLERRHILGWRDGMAEKPGAANKMIRTLKQLMAFALDRGFRKDNPATAIKLLKVGEWRPWTDEEMALYESHWPLGTFERSAYACALYLGQRRRDLAKLAWADVAGEKFRLKGLAKNGNDLLVPIHPALAKALAAIHPRSEHAILIHICGPKSKSYSPVYFGHLIAAAIEAAGLPEECVLHGLRKTAMVKLIEAGCTPHEAAAITGQRTLRMIEHYSKGANQSKLAESAVKKWGGK